MKRREILKLISAGTAAAMLPGVVNGARLFNRGYYAAGLKKPVSVYITWAAHDELADNVPLTEELAMKEFDALVRLKKQGMQFDYYLMDMFWFDKDSGYRAFKKEGWPNGPDKWLQACKDHGIKPGLWLSTNIMGWGTSFFMNPRPEWKNSAVGTGEVMSFLKGNFLEYHIETMQQWYDKGVRMFKFDFANFDWPSAEEEGVSLKRDHSQKNEDAWIEALKIFRAKNPEIVLLAYNGYGGEIENTFPKFKKSVSLKWLEVFDSLYCGDPRPADVPCMSFWRAKDIYSDHMVFQYEWNGIPLSSIDNTAFMIGTTNTCYNRRKQAWKGMAILSGARGGWMNTYYGNMELLDDNDGKWFAKVQKIFFSLQEFGQTSLFGNIPGTALPYGFCNKGQSGSVYTVVNPSQSVQTIELPEDRFAEGKLLFRDAGFTPQLNKRTVSLGPEQMAVVGFGEFANAKYDLGIQDDLIIPIRINKLESNFDTTTDFKASGIVKYNGKGNLRIVFQQVNTEGLPERILGRDAAGYKSISDLISLKAKQNGKELPLDLQFDKNIWSGLSWAVAEIKNKNIVLGEPIYIEYNIVNYKTKCIIKGDIYEAFY